MNKKLLISLAGLILVLFFTGCATGVPEASIEPTVSTVPLSSFDTIEVAEIYPAPTVEMDKNTSASIQKINEVFLSEIGISFDNIKIVGSAAEFSTSGNVLTVEITIKNIKIVSAGARAMGGSFAGNSAVLAYLVGKDASTGEKVCEGEFYREMSGMRGAYSMGAADSKMLGDFARELSAYLASNK